MSYLTGQMIDAIMKNNPKPIHHFEIRGMKFSLECDIKKLKSGIESLRNKLIEDSSRYGYHEYQSDPKVKLTNEMYQNNINEFIKEFENKLDYEYVEEIIAQAKKKKDGTLHRGRVYDEYVLKNASDTGSGTVNVYKIKYETVEDYVIRLVLHYATENIEYYLF